MVTSDNEYAAICECQQLYHLMNLQDNPIHAQKSDLSSPTFPCRLDRREGKKEKNGTDLFLQSFIRSCKDGDLISKLD